MADKTFHTGITHLAATAVYLLLQACGGGGDPAAMGSADAAKLGPKPGGSSGVVFNPASGDITGTDKPNLLRGTALGERLLGLGGHDVIFAAEGDDWLDGGPGNDRMVGGPGNDTYVVAEAGDRVVERDGEGTDLVLTTVSFDLPDAVENLSVADTGSSGLVLNGNALPNHIIGGSFSYDEIYGHGGDDILDGGGRHGGYLDGGEGNDRLLVSFGDLRGGSGADTFVAAGRGAHTSPEVPITVLDFNGTEGDRIEILHGETLSSAALFASGQLRFEPDTQRLVFDLDPSTTAPTSVDQVFILSGVLAFDPAWVSVRTP